MNLGKSKKYECEIEDCDSSVTIRTKVKNRDSEHYGKMVCNYHANMFSVPKEPKKYTIPYRTAKTTEKRKTVRSGYTEFFKEHIEFIQDKEICCMECGERLTGHVSEVCHLVAKSSNPEIATDYDNIIYLCGMFSKNNCHANFDSDFDKRNSMKVFPIAVKQFEKLKEKIIKITKEVLNYEEHIKE